jgi:hypothetical protein
MGQEDADFLIGGLSEIGKPESDLIEGVSGVRLHIRRLTLASRRESYVLPLYVYLLYCRLSFRKAQAKPDLSSLCEGCVLY